MYEANNIPFPFWGAATTKRSGRDPLAVQNSSVVIYDNMIKGITNVTGRVRYNGFFCWLLTFIAERLQATDPSKVDNPKEQIKYIRRGELLLTYSMIFNFPQVTGTSGSIFAQKHINDSYLDIALGADIEHKPEVYWQNTMGIFGQYYVGVLSQLRLIYLPDSGHQTYRVTSEGRKLCEIYRQSLSKEYEELYWNALHTGRFDKSQLNAFKGMALHQIENEVELEEYSKIFSGPERQDIAGKDVTHRIETIKLLLHYINGEGSGVLRNKFVLSFLETNFLYSLKEKLNVSEEQLSWFLYELNELTHAAYEAFHFAVLYSTTEEPQPLDSILNRLKKEYVESNNLPSEESEIYELYEELLSSYKTKEYGALLLIASRMLLRLYVLVHDYFDLLFEYAQIEGYDIAHPGFAPLLLLRLIGEEKRNCDWDFTESCIFTAINEHLRSSYSKSSIGQGIVHNYMLEDGVIWQIRRPDPIRTSPRLQNVVQYIEDMKWIERVGDSYIVTERGNNILINDGK